MRISTYRATAGRYWRWSGERYPLPAAMLYAGVQVVAAYGYGGLAPGAARFVWADVLRCWIVLFLMLFRLRVTDEEKDFAQDVRAYPDRLLSKGAVTLSGLYRLFAVALAVEFAVCLSLGRVMVYLWLAVNVWFLLMYVEFCVPAFLNRHIGWYLVTHQALLPLFALLPIGARSGRVALVAVDGTGLILFLMALMGSTMTYEMARKTWPPEREHPHAISYSREWGIPVAIVVCQGVAWLACAGFARLFARHAVPAWPLIPMIIANLVFTIAEVRFLKSPDSARGRLLTMAGAVVMLNNLAGAALAFLVAA